MSEVARDYTIRLRVSGDVYPADLVEALRRLVRDCQAQLVHLEVEDPSSQDVKTVISNR